MTWAKGQVPGGDKLAFVEEWKARGWLLNYSSGAGEFKRRRGGRWIEYNAIYSRHLPAHRQAACREWKHATNRVYKRFLEGNVV